MESIEKKLISAFGESWDAVAPSLLACPSSLKLLALREVQGNQMTSALAVANTWSAAFVVSCSGALPGLLIYLIKNEEMSEIEKLARQQADGALNSGSRALVNQTLERVADALDDGDAEPLNFDPALFIDLTIGESRLNAIAGDKAWIGTFTFTIGDDIDTQSLLLYAPNGLLENDPAASATNDASAPQAAEAPTPASSPRPRAADSSRSPMQRHDEAMPRNIDRLLDVELDVIVRFGVTNMPLRDIVRMGVGTMIELNRAVDDPVELLVNGRQLARGEVVVVDGYYGIRITEIGAPAERAQAII